MNKKAKPKRRKVVECVNCGLSFAHGAVPCEGYVPKKSATKRRKAVRATKAWVVLGSRNILDGDFYADPAIAESEAGWKVGSRVVPVLITELMTHAGRRAG